MAKGKKTSLIPTNKRREIVLEEYLKGTSITDIAKMVDVNRQTIYTDLDREDMKKNIEKARQQNLKNVTNTIMIKSNKYMNELERLASTTKDEKLKANILTYLLDHAIGKATTKIETKDTSENKAKLDNVDIDAILDNYTDKAQDVDYVEEDNNK